MQQNTEVDRDENGNALLTEHTIKGICRADLLPQQPKLIDKLYLIDKGFRKIDNLYQFTNLVSLWLNNNLIDKIENLSQLTNLVCLYLNNNKISKIENLIELRQLQILNLENNQIHVIEGLQSLKNLKNLNVASNLLSNVQSISHVKQIASLTNLDLSSNQIQNTEQIYTLISSLSSISCLYLKATPFARGFKNYKKKIIATLPRLKFFDDRPIQQSDHRICEAWLIGGDSSQKQLRLKLNNQQNKINQIKRQQINDSRKQKQQQKPKISEQIQINQTEQQRSNNEKQKQKNAHNLNSLQFKDSQNKPNATQKNYAQNIHEEKLELPYQINQINKNDKKEAQNWRRQYEPILQSLLEKHKFDFSEVQPQFNMIISNINKKLNRANYRFQIKKLQKIWTIIERRRREMGKI